MLIFNGEFFHIKLSARPIEFAQTLFFGFNVEDDRASETVKLLRIVNRGLRRFRTNPFMTVARMAVEAQAIEDSEATQRLFRCMTELAEHLVQVNFVFCHD